MRIPKQFRQFSLRSLFLATLACCVVVYFDPLGWRPAPPVPIKTVDSGQTAEVDLIEVNHLYDTSGRWVFDQLLFWSFHADGKLHLREWRLLRNPSMMPQRGYKKWVCEWTEHGVNRRVEAPAFQETKSTSDHELLDRESLPKQDRIVLWSSASIRPPGGAAGVRAASDGR
jgi:hypothetical protein